MSPLSLIVAALVAGLVAGFGGSWQVQAWRHDANELQRQQKLAQDARRAAAQVDRSAERLALREADADAREGELERRTHAELQSPASRGPCLSPDGLRILSDAAGESNARRGIAPGVSASSAPR